MDWNESKILIHFNLFEQNMDWKNSIYIISILHIFFFLIERNKNRFVFILSYGLKWI